MPNNLQRLPAERVRHRKRLPFQGWPDAAPLAARQFTLTGPITITQIIPKTTANADTTTSASAPPPTSAPPASAPPATPSLPTNSNPPAPPAPPVVSQTPGTTLAPGPPSPSASVINPSSSATKDAQVNGGLSVSNQHGLPTGAVVGITIACVMLILGAFIFFIRQRAVRNRKLRTQTAPWLGAPRSMNSSFEPREVNPYGSVPSGAGNMGEASPGVSFARAPVPVPPTMPASSYNNPIAAPVPGGAGSTATVRYEFIPSLPDELSITTGEVVSVISEYDDGWTLCKNGRGDQGMVPLECLDRGSAPAQDTQQDYRNSRRTSSLQPGF